MSAVRHVAAVKRCCSRGMVTGEDILRVEMTGERSVRDTKMIRNRFLKVPKNSIWSIEDENEVAQEEERNCDQGLIRNHFLSSWPSFLKTFVKAQGVQGVRSYSQVTYKLSHIPYYGISKLVKKCTMNCLPANKLRTKAD